MIIDNCCSWKAKLQQVFGNIPVKLDLFHAVQRITSKISKRHVFSHTCSGELDNVFVANGDTSGANRKLPIPQPEEIERNLDSWMTKWKPNKK